MSDERVGRGPAGSNEARPDALDALAEDVLPALIARLRASRLGELEVRTERWRVRLRRDASAARVRSASGDPGTVDDVDDLGGSVARSSAVGYFSPVPDLVVGRAVQAGDVLGSIDVLGIAQEVTAPGDGIVSSILAEEGQAVEYGQALAEIDVLDSDSGVDAPRAGQAATKDEP